MKKYYRGECKSCTWAINEYTYRERVVKALLELSVKYECRNCGYSNNLAALHFHHRNPKDKKLPISQMKTRSYDELKQEISKCDILCANCHMEEHHSRLNK